MTRHITTYGFAALFAFLSFPAYAQVDSGTITPKDIAQMHAFPESVIPLAVTSADENRQVAQLLGTYALEQQQPDELDAIAGWCEAHPSSPWTCSLSLNAADAYYRTGYFTRAMSLWRTGWDAGKSYETVNGRALADSCFGGLCRMTARIGRMTELQQLLQEDPDRARIGPGATLLEQSRDALGVMKLNPGIAFKCGPLALANILKAQKAENPYPEAIVNAQSTPLGFSLGEVEALAATIGMDYHPARRVSNEGELPMPSVIHWKLGHYAALVRKEGERYLVQDPTFGDDLWITRAALEEEASGYFLIARNAHHTDFVDVTTTESAEIRGRGQTSSRCKQGTGPCDKKTGGANSCPTCPNCPSPGQNGSGSAPLGHAMPQYSFHMSLTSLHIFDTPVGYQPPIGPAVYMMIDYNQREADQPTIFPYSNFGYKWCSTWISYVIDDPTSGSVNATVYLPEGGSEVHSSWNSSTNSYSARSFGSSQLFRTSSSPIIYERRDSNGWKQVYSHVESSAGTSRRTLLTALVDPYGNQITLNYDTINRLVSVDDALGRSTTFCYALDGSGNCTTDASNYRIRKVTDPFGRSARFDYDASNRLVAITDVIGMQSTFSYDAGDFITSMTTPYGTTSFAKESAGSTGVTFIEATDPLGDKERVEFQQVSGLPGNLQASELPAAGTVNSSNNYMQYRNVFYWNKKAMREGAAGDYSTAKITHFLHDPAFELGRAVENEKEPLEGRIFYNYPGQVSPWNVEGTFSQPSKIARKLDNGATQYTQIAHNAQGNPTVTTDTLGRVAINDYDTSGIDVIKVRQKDASGYVTLMEAQYNSQHQPTLITDAAGQQTTSTYNAFGKLTSRTNAKFETSTLDYSTTGLLLRVTSPDPRFYKEMSYDWLDRVTSVTMFPPAYTIQYAFDALDRSTRVTYPDGTYEEQVWDKLDVIKSRDRLGQATQMRYTLLDQLAAVTNPAGETVQYDWCRCGGIARLVDAEGRMTTWYRDLQSRVTKKEFPDLSSETYSYETNTSRVKTHSDAKAQNTNFTYNNDDTPAQISITNVAPGTSAVPTVTMAWNQYFKRLNSYTDGLGTTNFGYVAYNPADTTYGDGKLASVDGPWSNDTIAYTYDELGRQTQRTINGTSNVVTLAYDSMSHVTTTTNNLGTFTYDYSVENGQLAKIMSSYGHVTNFSYKNILEDMRLDTIENRGTTGGLISKFMYGYDKIGRITEWTQMQEDSPGDAIPDRMKYDYAGRLSEVFKQAPDGSGTQYDWRYDRSGNRLNEQIESFSASGSSVQRQAYGISIADQITSIINCGPLHVEAQLDEQGKATQTGPVTTVLTEATSNSVSGWIDTTSCAAAILTTRDWNSNTTSTQLAINATNGETRSNVIFDANGNLTSYILTAADGITTSLVEFEWDALNRLMAISGAGHRSEFTYNGNGRRVRIIEKDGSGNVTDDKWFVWEGLSIAQERTTSNGTPIKNFFTQGEVRGGTNYYYSRDHLGSLRAVSDVSGNLLAQYDYDTYGNPTQTLGADVIQFDQLYTGYLYHAPSDTYLAPFRAYDPSVGKWISREPTGRDAPNLYTYVFNSPILHVDPDGLRATLPPPIDYPPTGGNIPTDTPPGMAPDIAQMNINTCADECRKETAEKMKHIGGACGTNADLNADCMARCMKHFGYHGRCYTVYGWFVRCGIIELPIPHDIAVIQIPNHTTPIPGGILTGSPWGKCQDSGKDVSF